MEKTKIQWAESTYNPWYGCAKVSRGCKFCYFFRDKARYGQDPTKIMRSKTMFYAPLKWKEPKLIFTCSWSDWFIEEADQWRGEAWEVIRKTPQHTYQILTKRPERILEHLPDDWGDGYDNVWLGVSVEDNKVKHRINTLAEIPAKVRFISAEPLIGELNLIPEATILNDKIDWIVIGGESGNEIGKHRYRPAKLEWFEHIIHVCIQTEVSVFVKQFGTYLSKEMGLKDRHGGNMEEFPEALQIREFPIKYNTNNNLNLTK